MDARLFRDGRTVNYDREHAAALFESTFALNWGNAPGSGLETHGSFQDLIVPDLLDVLREYEVKATRSALRCNIRAAWPYGIEFLSVHWHRRFPGWTGTPGSSHYVDGRPFLYAMMQLTWEP
jgi:hypothetical protein